MIGKTIGKYRIVEKLGHGGMGTVFKAIDETLGREVAVKVLSPDLSDTAVVKRFELEAAALTALSHPEIAAVYEIQRTGTDVLMVMELVRGETLDQMLRRLGALPPERAAYLMAQILSTLGRAHAVGVIHRDLKPSNVMFTELGGVKLLDFGVARLEAAAQMTAAGFTIGTPAYMAPERIQGEDVDARADLYSVGVLFYRLLTNKLPFEAPTPTEMVQKLLTAPPTPARSYRPDLPEWCERVLSRVLAKSPADRFQSAEEFRSALLGSIASAANDATGVFQSVATPPPAAPAAPPSSRAFDGEVTMAVATPALTPVPPAAAAASIVPAPAAEAVDPLGPTLLAPVPAGPLGIVGSAADPAKRTARDAGRATPRAQPAPLPPAAVRASGAPTDDRDFTAGASPTMAMPIDGAAIVQGSVPDHPTFLVPAASAPTVAAPYEALATTAAAPTVAGPVASAPTGKTLVMERKQFAAAGLLLAGLAVGVVVLAVIVLRRPAAIHSPATDTTTTAVDPTTSAPAIAPPAPDQAPLTPPPSPPLAILDPPIRTSPDAPPPPPSRPVPRETRPPAATEPTVLPSPVSPPATATTPARAVNTTPFKFEAKAVVVDGDKRRERDANVLVGDGSITVTQKNDTVLYVVAVTGLRTLTYSNSRQPLWNSPSGPAEAMRVESGAFGFLKGGRNWLGFQSADSLMVLRVDDEIVGRVIAGLQERTGLTVARLIEPKE